MTHRDRARNAASSRAIPWPKMMERIIENPVTPIKFGLEQRGMQEGEEIHPELEKLAHELWLQARDSAVHFADALHNIGRTYAEEKGDDSFADVRIHKSLPNRITEPWMYITVVMTATDWKNFLRLRNHEDAEVHFQRLAECIQDVLETSKPIPRKFGEWHFPYLDERVEDLRDIYSNAMQQKGELWNLRRCSFDEFCARISTARCARVSYLTQDGKRDLTKDLQLFDRLVRGSGFGHWSPHEHVAACATPDVRSGPFKGWIQYRKFFLNENADK